MATGVALLATFGTADAAGATPVKVPEVQLVVKVSGTTGVHVSSILGGLPGSTPASLAADRYTFEVPQGEVASTLARLQSSPGVQYASVVHAVHATGLPNVPNDQCYTGTCSAANETGVGPSTLSVTQSDLRQIGAPTAWSIAHGSPSVLVAVLDTGVDHNNPDLGSNVVVGPNLCSGGLLCGVTSPTDTDVSPLGGGGDESGHGTHVTGTIGANVDTGANGVAGLGWDARVETFKVLDGTGGGTTADVANGIYAAISAGARVINMSLGNDACSYNPQNCGPDPDTQAAVEAALAHNIVVVAAAGNDGSSGPTYPASYPGVLSVASVNGANVTSYFSEFGGAANISAPGENIVSTYNNGITLAVLEGTSMATPHVAAAAALVLAANPRLSAAQVTSILRGTASPEYGNPINGGVVNVGRAVALARAGGVYRGYRLAGSDGSVYAFGSSPALGSLTGHPLNKPVVAIADRTDHTGYWMAATDGGVFQFGSAGYFGSTGNVHLNQPIVGMASTPDGGGYWLVGADGGIFDFGDAGFYGSTGNVRLNKPIVGMAATHDGKGYWLVASDGGIFDFGDAGFYGSTGNVALNKPVVGMAPSAGGGGYWLVASDGGIFQFGNAGFHGSTGNVHLNRPIVGMQGTSDGGGYWLTASDGGIFQFGDAQFEGSAGGSAIPAPVVGIS